MNYEYNPSALKVFIAILLESLLRFKLGFDQAVRVAMKKISLSREERIISYRIGYETVVNFYGLRELAKHVGFGTSVKSIAKYLELIGFDFEEYWRAISDYTDGCSITEKLSLKYGYPSWLVKNLTNLLGVDETEKTLKSLNERKRWVRVNTAGVKIDEAVKCLCDEDIRFHHHVDFKDLLEIEDPFYPIGNSKCVEKGYLIPEDIGSYILVESIHEFIGQDLLDACSAPGVKLLHVLSRKRISAIIAVDYSLKRLRNAKNLLKHVGEAGKPVLVYGDSRIIEYSRQLSTILLDAPCSGSGAVYGDPSVKLRLTENELGRYHDIQYELLRSALKNGRSVIYATCSIIPLEGEMVVQRLVDEFNIELIDLKNPYLDPAYPSYKVSLKTYRIKPHRVRGQGFYIAFLRGN